MKPNFLIFVVDEKRYPTAYETDELKLWREKNLLFEKELTESGITFTNHYTNSMACAPIRTTFHTGHYPTVHGVLNTDGLALSPTDKEMQWLPKHSIPTIGNWFEKAGWKTYLKGKWHVSDASIRLNSGEEMKTYDSEGKRLLTREQIYLEKDVLSDYGYHGWIGPEPHGTDPLNSAAATPSPISGRDIAYKEQVEEELKRLQGQSDPWLLMASFVNPHDITLFGALTSAAKSFDFPIDPTLPEKLFTDEFQRSHKEELTTKPKVQTDYRDGYPKMVQPIVDIDRYQRAYFTMQRDADRNMMEIWKRFKESSAYKNTYVLFFSDHGDLLASHGGQYQKWFSAYQETIKVPFIVSSPLLEDKGQNVSHLTSHIDILPTLLGLAGINQHRLRKALSPSFSLPLVLPGKDLSKYLLSERSKFVNTPVYFFTEDNPTKGPNQVNALGQPFEAIGGACCVEAIIHKVDDVLWKLTRYWSKDPNWRPSPGEILNELYRIDTDPMELNNLYGDESVRAIQQLLTSTLKEVAFYYRS